ncbi:MAG: bifunctional methylenetetrahydrofolate dehydrogenase/methenyltetrahydrofolate cyclohydrolase FolD [Desulfovibrio sp.]|nr:bifunctional methylenetetrahydrofolate dehydrogenase/methenyltetrahydrofolate cyclohydrolase FolD [Desulfovibrio sp.]
MLLLDGKATAQTVREELKKIIATAISAGRRPPGLAVILAGEDPASQVYVRNKEFACTHVGIYVETCRLPESVTEAEVVRCIDRFNQRSDIDGILVQLPLPKHIRPSICLLAIDPAKDVDGFHPENAGKLTLGLPGLRPCTPQGIIELLRRYGLSPRGKKAVVVGRSNIVGKPLAILLAEPLEYANATVTLCHSETCNLANECRQADFLFLAVGKPRFFTASMVREGSVVIDVGINRTPAGLCGDADFEGLKDHVSAITPVPGGIGPMTVAMLLKNTVDAWQGRTSASLKKETEISS